MILKNIWERLTQKSQIKSPYAKGQAYIATTKAANWMSRNYGEFAKEAYSKNVIANRCISLVAKAAASSDWQVVSKKNGRIYSKHPLLDILKKPNPLTGGVEFFESLVSYLLIAGNSFCLMIKASEKPVELHLLRPDRVTILSDGAHSPVAYKYKIGEYEYLYKIDEVTGKSDVMHLKNFHPLDDFYGLSSVEAAAFSIDQHNMAASWNQSLLQNGARPSGALIYKSDSGSYPFLLESQYERLREQIEQNFSGHNNAGKPFILDGGVEWKEMSLSNKEMEFLEAKNSAAREIALAFGVPPQILGIPGDNTYSNLQEARLALWEETIFPMLDNIKNHLNGFLVPYFGDDIEITYNKDNISALSSRRESLWDRIDRCSFLTENEKREIFGYEKV